MKSPDRRQFIKNAAITVAALIQAPQLLFGQGARARTTQIDSGGYFTLGRRKDRWWLITPDRKPFFSMGLNHIDPATLRYPENIDIWKEKYGGSPIRWIKDSLAPNLKSWGFNSVGWVQEVTVRQ